MSEKSKKTVCPQCGAEVDGNESKNLKQILNMLRGVLEDEDTDESEMPEEEPKEAAPLETSPNAVVSEAKPSLRERIKSIFANRLINRIAVFLLAVCMLALAFAPLASYEVKMADETTYTVGYSGVDHAQITMLSMLMGSGAGKLDTSLYEQAMQQQPDESAKEALLKQMMLVSSIYEGKGLHFTSMIAALAYVVYVILCIVFVIVAAVNLSVEFFTARKKRHRIKKCASDGLLCLLLCLLPAVCFCMLQACEICTGVGVLDFVTPMGAGLSWGAIISLVLAVLGGIFVCAAHSVGVLRLNRRYFDRSRIKHLVCVVLIVLVFLSSLLPCLQVRMWDPQTNMEKTLSMNFWEIREMTSEEWMAYRRAPDRIDQAYITQTIAAEELAEHAGEYTFHTLLITSDMMTVFSLYAFMEIVSMLTLLFAGVWLFGILRRCFFGKKRRRLVNLFKVLTLISICVNFIFVIVIRYLASVCLQGNLIYMMKFSVGTGMIGMFICALLGLILRLREKRPMQYVDEEYDNADVSYAPYVLDSPKKEA